ncbi:MAG: DNA primase [Pseudomonadota bacterium]
MSLPPGFLEELRTRVSLAAVAGRKVSWDKSRSNPSQGDWWAPCPFHQEKTASFHVRDREGFYYCFGCHAKGDAISFLRELENMSFMEAVEALAQEAGMTLPARDPQAAEREAARKTLADVMERCVQHFRLQLRSAAAQEARDYLARRGLSAETLERFEIGYAPEARRGLAEAMAGKGVSEEELVRCGLLATPEDGGAVYDRFRGRIMFPIRDSRGRCISFGGRALSPQARAKYLNGPQTELFDKSRNLYNLQGAREAAGRAGRLVVAEGYMDVIALSAAGFEESVAPLGTAITEDQLKLMWRLADEPVIALDGDEAGLRAARRLVELALPLIEPGRSLQFCLLPQGKDPDDLIREGGPQAMEAALGASVPLVEMCWRKVAEGRDVSSPERRAALEQELRGLLRSIPDARLRRHYGEALKAKLDGLFRPARPAGGGGRGGGRRFARGGGRAGVFGFADAGAAPPTPETRRTLLVTAAESGGARIRESAILWAALHHPELAERRESELAELRFLNRDLAEMRDVILAALPQALEAEAPAEALRAAVESAAGADPRPFLMTERVALTRALGPEATAEQAAVVFSEVLERHVMFLSALEEGKAATEEISLETADEIAHRLAYISHQREEAARRGDAAEATARDEEEDLSARLRAFIAAEPWVKTPRGSK